MSDSSSTSDPMVSVGLPLYNGEKYLRESLDSILNQTFTDFEVVISDNASTDATQSICEEYAKKDSRIRYIRYEENRGGPWNFNNTFDLSRGKYFNWAAYDDRIRPRFLEACVEALEERPDYVCCWPNNDVIKGDGSLYHRYEEPEMEHESDRPHLRFRDAVFGTHSTLQVYGVIRSDVLRKTCKMAQWICSDTTLEGQLALYGKFYLHPEYLFERRYHEQSSWKDSGQQFYAYDKIWRPVDIGDKIRFPYWKMTWENVRSIFTIPIPWSDRMFCLWYSLTRRQRLSGRKQYWLDIKNALRLFFKSPKTESTHEK